MVVAMRLEDIRGMERLDAVEHHAPADAADHTDRQSITIVFFGDVIKRGFRVKLRPTIDVFVVQRIRIFVDQVRASPAKTAVMPSAALLMSSFMWRLNPMMSR